MTIAIIGAMDEELAPLKQRMTMTMDMVSIAGIEIYQGELCSHQSVLLAKSGIGKVNGAICVALLVEKYGCDFVLNIGSAAAVDDALNLGDVVVAETVRYHDVDAVGFGYELGQVPRMPVYYQVSESHLQQARALQLDQFSADVCFGEVVSGDVFVNEVGRVRENFPSALAVEMEAGGIAQACYAFQVPFLITRSISDKGDSEALMTHEEFLQLSAENASTFVSQLLSQLS